MSCSDLILLNKGVIFFSRKHKFLSRVHHFVVFLNTGREGFFKIFKPQQLTLSTTKIEKSKKMAVGDKMAEVFGLSSHATSPS